MNKYKKILILHSFILVVMGILGSLAANNLAKAIQYYDKCTHAEFVEEYATIVKYEVDQRYWYTEYSTYYEYTINEETYYGCWERGLKDEEYAKSQVGKKIVIFVDHKLKLHVLDLNFTTSDIWFATIICAVCWTIFMNSFIRGAKIIYRCLKTQK